MKSRVGSQSSTLRAAFPTLSAADRELLLRLHEDGAEIQAWFEADPARVEALRASPYEVLNELRQSLGAQLPAVLSKAELPQLTILLNPLACSCAPPSLLTAVWEHVGEGRANLAAWKEDPYLVIREVASTTGAPAQDEDLLIHAFEVVLGKQPILTLQARIRYQQGASASQLVVRRPEAAA